MATASPVMKPANVLPSLTKSRDFITSEHFRQRVWLNCSATDKRTFSGFLVKFQPQAVFHFAIGICHPALATRCHTRFPFLLSQDDTHRACFAVFSPFCCFSSSPSTCSGRAFFETHGVRHMGVEGCLQGVQGIGVPVPFPI